jgi:deoxyribonuclease-4
MVILIGPAGTGGSSPEGFELIKKSGLDAVEIEFTYSIWMKKEDAIKINSLNKKMGLCFSIHAPYFINLASKEKAKVGASKARILKCCEIGHYLGAKYIVFHAGFYQDLDKDDVFDIIKEAIVDIQDVISEKRWNVILAPETTGKATQFGDLDELIRLKKETGCHLCVDFSHLKARYNGVIDYDMIMKKLKPLGHIHSHFSGIEWTAKGERRHILTSEDYILELFKYLKKYDIDVTIINESPDPLGDAVKMKKLI